MKRILITGEASYIGMSVEKYLNQFEGEYEITTISVRTDDWKNHDFSKYDVVYHVAGIVHQNKVNTETFMMVNTKLPTEIALKAKESGVKHFIFMSTMSVFGLEHGEINENTIPRPKNDYGKSKLEAEKNITNIRGDNFKVTIVRPPMVYGFKSPGNYNRLSNLAKKIPFYPDYKNQRSMIHILNLCNFIKVIIDRMIDGVYHPQNNQLVDTTKLIEEIRKVNGLKKRAIKILNILIIISKPFFSPIRKIYGDLFYNFKENHSYQIINFEESIIQSERG